MNRKNTREWALYKEKRECKRRYKKYYPGNHVFKKPGVLTPPGNFSMLSNGSAVIEYLSNVKERIERHLETTMDLSNVKFADLVSVSVVISMMMDARLDESGSLKHLSVIPPSKSSAAYEIFNRAQFRQTVTRKGISDHNYFMSRRNTVINKKYLDDIIFHTKNFFGDDAYIKDLNGLLVEIFSNTNNHASPMSATNKIPWFISIYEGDCNKLEFCVVDLGVGIYESLKMGGGIDASGVKTDRDPVDELYDNRQSEYLRKSIPVGVYSTTGEPYRGKGLKTIYDTVSTSTIFRKCVIITNRARVDLRNIDRVTSNYDYDSKFEGTIIYWTMDRSEL